MQLVYGKEAEYFAEQPHYTLVCDAREVESEEEEVFIICPVPYLNK